MQNYLARHQSEQPWTPPAQSGRKWTIIAASPFLTQSQQLNKLRTPRKPAASRNQNIVILWQVTQQKTFDKRANYLFLTIRQCHKITDHILHPITSWYPGWHRNLSLLIVTNRGGHHWLVLPFLQVNRLLQFFPFFSVTDYSLRPFTKHTLKKKWYTLAGFPKPVFKSRFIFYRGPPLVVFFYSCRSRVVYFFVFFSTFTNAMLTKMWYVSRPSTL